MSSQDPSDETRPHHSLLSGVTGELKNALELSGFGLEVLSGENVERTFSAQRDRTAVGAHKSNDLVLEDATVSRFHCEIRAEADGVRIRDLESKNGTIVDGLRIVEAYLRQGSIIKLGDSTLRFLGGSERLAIPLSDKTCFGSLVGHSVAMRSVYGMLERCAASNITVLLEGETGTGKEAAAEAIHDHSSRAEQPFVVVDCGSIPANLLESELFGHEKGAFTGAVSARAGAFEAAHGGTIFLDEIGELPLDLQPKLLRVLEQRTIRRLGSTKRQGVDVRVVAATNRRLRNEVNEGQFRSDLYYRLAVVKVDLPPLREHLEDLPELIGEMLDRLAASGADRERLLAGDFLQRLATGSWPGNVRELRNYLERSLVFSESEIPLGDSGSERPEHAYGADASLSYAEARRRAILDFERRYLGLLMDSCGNNVSRAARQAGIDRVYLHRLLRRHRGQ